MLLGSCKYYERGVKQGVCISVSDAEKVGGSDETGKECLKKPIKVCVCL